MKYPMQGKCSILLMSFCALILSASQVQADMDAIHNSDNAIWGSVGAELLGYKEPSPPPNLSDSERDWIPSGAAGVNFLSDGSLVYFGLEGSLTYGDAHYNGAYLISPTTPLESTTRETITTVDGKLGQGFALGNSTMLIPYVELGFRYWDRNLGAGEVENYNNFDTLGGLMLQVSPMQNLVVSAYGSGGTTIAPKMNTGGNAYTLGDSAVYKVGGKIGYNIGERTELFTTLDYDHFSYGQSPVVSNFTYEPNSNTNETAVRVGLAYHFQ